MGQHFCEGIPVVMSLTAVADDEARQFVDFAATWFLALPVRHGVASSGRKLGHSERGALWPAARSVGEHSRRQLARQHAYPCSFRVSEAASVLLSKEVVS